MVALWILLVFLSMHRKECFSLSYLLKHISHIKSAHLLVHGVATWGWHGLHVFWSLISSFSCSSWRPACWRLFSSPLSFPNLPPPSPFLWRVVGLVRVRGASVKGGKRETEKLDHSSKSGQASSQGLGPN